MDAEFYCVNAHLDSVGHLLRSLNKFVDPTIAVKVMNFDPEGRTARRDLGQRYTQLLYATIPPERELSIEAVGSMELFGNRIYLRIYWPMLTEQYGWDSNVGQYVRNLRLTTSYRQFHAGMHGLELFLPALAIRDRMVLVPKGQNKTLEGMGSNDPTQPVLQRSVIEVDFADASDIERACIQVGEELRKELRYELAAYHSYNLSDQSDFDTVSALLGVPPSLLRRAIREEADARELIYNQLSCTVEPTTIVADVQTRITIVVDNPSGVELGDLRMQVRGPSSGLAINPERVALRLGANSSARADFSVVAGREGEFVLETIFLDPDFDAPRDMMPAQQIWITSTRRPER
jgi:hypothetical protein